MSIQSISEQSHSYFDSRAAGWATDDPFFARHKRRRSGAKLLLVEDDPHQRQYFAALLAREGHQVQTAETAQEALELLHRQPFDCLICDLLLPSMDARELIKRLRAHRMLAELPIIVLTSSQGDIEMELLAGGADLFCEKRHAARRLRTQVALMLY